MAETKMMKTLSFLQVILAIGCALGAPIISGLLSYQTAIGDTKVEFVRARLENEQAFVKKEDFKEISRILYSIDTRLSVIESRTRR